MNLTGDRNQCPGCKAYFNSILAFDKHRTGKHGQDRRCLAEHEMLAKGMSQNSAGFWISKAMPFATRTARARSRDQGVGKG
jgi:hypothetical protein